MVVYHGSSRNFNTLRIAKGLVRNNATLLNEGTGIYFSTDRSVAASYGKYLYTIEINNKHMSDFRNMRTTTNYIVCMLKRVLDDTKVDISRYVNIKHLAMTVINGQIAIYQIHREIGLLLDSEEDWHLNLSERKREDILRSLRIFNNETLVAYLFNNAIPNIGVIKKLNEQDIKIINKEKIM